VGLGGTLLLSIAVTSLTGALLRLRLEQVELGGSPWRPP
jgi:hypothetical protein